MHVFYVGTTGKSEVLFTAQMLAEVFKKAFFSASAVTISETLQMSNVALKHRCNHCVHHSVMRSGNVFFINY